MHAEYMHTGYATSAKSGKTLRSAEASRRVRCASAPQPSRPSGRLRSAGPRARRVAKPPTRGASRSGLRRLLGRVGRARALRHGIRRRHLLELRVEVGRCLLELRVVEPEVGALRRDELVVGALLDDVAVL